MAQSLADLVGLVERSPSRLESKHNAEFNGGLDPRFAYGGGSLAFGINAASATVKDDYRMYSAMGNFLNVASTAHKLHAEVTSIRDTRTFATRRIDISQYPNGKDQKPSPIMFMVVDFMAPEPSSLITYSAPSTMEFSSPANSMSSDDLERAAKEKGVSDKLFDAMKRRFGNMEKYVERLYCPEGVNAQNFNGMAPELPTTQDQLAVTDKRSMWWFRNRTPAKSHSKFLSCSMSEQLITST
jgi:acyl-CoA thioesterase